MNKTLDYKTRTLPQRLSFRTAAVGGVIVGIGTCCFAFLVGKFLYLGICALAGIILSSITARVSPGSEFRAGFVASAIAAASAFVAAICAQRMGFGAGRPDVTWSAFLAISWWALFAVPGMLGSLWYWEGRKPREWDANG